MKKISDLEEDEVKNVIILLWIMETRIPDIYKTIQSQPNEYLKNDYLSTAIILAKEFKYESNDDYVDLELYYKKMLQKINR